MFIKKKMQQSIDYIKTVIMSYLFDGNSQCIISLRSAESDFQNLIKKIKTLYSACNYESEIWHYNSDKNTPEIGIDLFFTVD